MAATTTQTQRLADHNITCTIMSMYVRVYIAYTTERDSEIANQLHKPIWIFAMWELKKFCFQSLIFPLVKSLKMFFSSFSPRWIVCFSLFKWYSVCFVLFEFQIKNGSQSLMFLIRMVSANLSHLNCALTHWKLLLICVYLFTSLKLIVYFVWCCFWCDAIWINTLILLHSLNNHVDWCDFAKLDHQMSQHSHTEY